MSEPTTEKPFYKNAEGLQRMYEMNKIFIEDLKKEKERLGEEFPLCALLVDEAIERIMQTGRIPGKELHADVYKQKPLKVIQKVFIPVREFPKFNFIGKVLGPKGNSLRRLQEETQCKIILKGRHSIRDNVKEEELRNSGDPKHAHLHKDLHVQISTIATPAEAYARVAYALAEIRKYIIPDKNDEVAQEQKRELMKMNPDAVKTSTFAKYKSILEGRQEGASDSSKYVDLIKKTSFEPPMTREVYEEEIEGEEEAYEIAKPYVIKRPKEYEYTPLQPQLTRIKRPQQTMYVTEVKRVRGEPTPYKTKPYSILQKYK